MCCQQPICRPCASVVLPTALYHKYACPLPAWCHVQAKEQLVRAHAEVKDTLSAMYKYFEADSEEVQREWVRFTQKVDKRLEDALRTTVKRSLQVRRCYGGAAAMMVLLAVQAGHAQVAVGVWGSLLQHQEENSALLCLAQGYRCPDRGLT
jgi:hypothetical protein